MSSIFIFVFACFALVRFGISQWRAIWITVASQPLAEALHAAARIDEDNVGAQDFGTLIGFCDKLAPGLQKTSPWLREVSIYYRVIASLQRICKLRFPSVSTWAKREMHICSRYVAVVLGQSLSLQLDRQAARPQV
jgi:hypothetical protein